MKNIAKPTEKIIKIDVREVDGAIYTYRLTESMPRKIGKLSIPLYSIYIEMKRGSETDENSIKDIFADVGKALTFYSTLLKHLATPIDLHYILEDRITL